MKNLACEADRIAASFRQNPTPNWERLRDYIDRDTYGCLECVQLDILTDMVEKRIKGLAH